MTFRSERPGSPLPDGDTEFGGPERAQARRMDSPDAAEAAFAMRREGLREVYRGDPEPPRYSR